MYSFHYDVIAKIWFTDIDSSTYINHIHNIHRDMLALKDQHFNINDYAQDHFPYLPFNAKVLDLMKDECGGEAALKFIGLRSKIYGL
jgi:hypothetical protein